MEMKAGCPERRVERGSKQVQVGKCVGERSQQLYGFPYYESENRVRAANDVEWWSGKRCWKR